MVLIKEMLLPFSCDQCRFKDRHHNECIVAWKRVGSYGMDFGMRKPKWCPLVDVEPYGPDGILYKEK